MMLDGTMYVSALRCFVVRKPGFKLKRFMPRGSKYRYIRNLGPKVTAKKALESAHGISYKDYMQRLGSTETVQISSSCSEDFDRAVPQGAKHGAAGSHRRLAGRTPEAPQVTLRDVVLRGPRACVSLLPGACTLHAQVKVQIGVFGRKGLMPLEDCDLDSSLHSCPTDIPTCSSLSSSPIPIHPPLPNQDQQKAHLGLICGRGAV